MDNNPTPVNNVALNTATVLNGNNPDAISTPENNIVALPVESVNVNPTDGDSNQMNKQGGASSKHYLMALDRETGIVYSFVRGAGVVPEIVVLQDLLAMNGEAGRPAHEKLAFIKSYEDLGPTITLLNTANKIDLNRYEVFVSSANADLPQLSEQFSALSSKDISSEARLEKLNAIPGVITISNPVEKHFFSLPDSTQQDVLAYFYSVSENSTSFNITFDGKFHLPADPGSRKAFFAALHESNYLNAMNFKSIANGAEMPQSQSRTTVLGIARDVLLDPARTFIAEVGDVRGLAPSKRPGLNNKKKGGGQSLKINNSQ